MCHVKEINDSPVPRHELGVANDILVCVGRLSRDHCGNPSDSYLLLPEAPMLPNLSENRVHIRAINNGGTAHALCNCF